MLTRHDRTVEDCLAVMESVAPIGLKHVGFKDVGVDRHVLGALVERIRAAGAASYLELVSTDDAACVEAAAWARDTGVTCVLGGMTADAIAATVRGSETEYYPFVGRPQGHPTRLAGSVDEVVADCRGQSAAGHPGVDLLAYRAVDAEPLALVRGAREATDGRIIVAGDVNSPQRIADIAEAGADAFTIGTAAFDGSFSPHKGALTSQLQDIVSACRQEEPA